MSVNYINYNITSDGTAVAQSYSAAVTVGLFANSSNMALPVAPGQQVSFTLTTGSYGVNANQQLVLAVSEEDYADILDSDRAMADARANGVTPWRQARKILGL
jgi:hypothetical protein